MGYPHPDYLLSKLSSRQLSEWMAYASIEPFGEERADLRSAIICSVIANVNKKKNAPPFKPEDFMPYRQKERKQTLEEHKAFFMGLTKIDFPTIKKPKKKAKIKTKEKSKNRKK